MRFRTSPIVLATNALRTLVQLAVGGAVVAAGVAALGAWGYRFDLVVETVHSWLVRIVTG